MIISGNFARIGVIGGFALIQPTSGLVATITLGALFAQGTLWRPGTAPTVPSAPVSQFSYLAYNSSAGLYWTTNPAGTTAGDAVLGWAQTSASKILAVSSQTIAVGTVTSSSSGGGSGVSGISGGAFVWQLAQADVTVTPYNVSLADEVLTFKAGASVVNLPALSSVALRRPLWLINKSGGTLTLNPFSGDTSGGLSSFPLYDGAAYQFMPNA